MFPENPGVAICRRHVRIVPTSDTAADMAEAMKRMVPLGLKLAGGDRVGSATEEGYLPRGVRYNEIAEVPSAQRAVDMVLKRIRGEPFVSELILSEYDKVAPPPPIENLRSTKLAIVTESGLVPPGNPDRIAGTRASNWNHYSIEGKEELDEGCFIFIHGGYNTVFVNEDPDRMVGLDVLRELEREGIFADLHNEILSTCGNGGSLLVMQKIGQEMAKEVKRAGVTGVILPAT
jgi:glycine reductase